ncbi:hypothetical protein BC831DRAFT_467036 [Entophlyctis helioformis]|nr:hypothetical protein BC831DRAFT_467036 [Entophlyctis helioformis]
MLLMLLLMPMLLLMLLAPASAGIPQENPAARTASRMRPGTPTSAWISAAAVCRLPLLPRTPYWTSCWTQSRTSCCRTCRDGGGLLVETRQRQRNAY